MKEEAWTLNSFELGKILGRGQFGTVYKAREKRTNKLVALKQIKKSVLENYDFFSQTRTELEIHCRLRHPNILRLYGYFYDKDGIYVVLELAEHGNLYQTLKSAKRFSEERSRHILRQLIDALVFLQ